MKPPSMVVMTTILQRNEGPDYNTEAVFTEGITTFAKVSQSLAFQVGLLATVRTTV